MYTVNTVSLSQTSIPKKETKLNFGLQVLPFQSYCHNHYHKVEKFGHGFPQLELLMTMVPRAVCVEFSFKLRNRIKTCSAFTLIIDVYVSSS